MAEPSQPVDQLPDISHPRYTAYVRSILELAARGGSPPELAEITNRLDRIERALSGGLPHDDKKTALRTSVRAGPALLVSAACHAADCHVDGGADDIHERGGCAGLAGQVQDGGPFRSGDHRGQHLGFQLALFGAGPGDAMDEGPRTRARSWHRRRIDCRSLG